MSLFNEYWDKLANAFANFQFIEEAIRMYVTIVYEIVKKKLGNQIPFKFSYTDVKNDSLGTLIAKFEKVNSNQQLINKLKKLCKQRNHYAHQGYLMTKEKRKDDKYLSVEIKKLKSVISSSDECFKLLNKEAKRIIKVNKEQR